LQNSAKNPLDREKHIVSRLHARAKRLPKRKLSLCEPALTEKQRKNGCADRFTNSQKFGALDFDNYVFTRRGMASVAKCFLPKTQLTKPNAHKQKIKIRSKNL